MSEIDQIEYSFDANALFLLNIAVGFIMFGVALGLTPQHFINVLKAPKKLMAGLLSQLVLLPLLTLVIVFIAKPQASIALGMILISVCPGGNISNFMSSLAGANVALSVSLTAMVSVLAILVTPLGLAFWGSQYGPSNDILRVIELNILDVFKTISMIIIVPMILGMTVRKYKPLIARKLESWLKILSMVIFIIMVIAAVATNFKVFITYIPFVMGLVVIHNIVAYVSGYSLSKIFRLPIPDQKTLTIETGIQNSGLALVLIFGFFEGLGGMTLVAAAWGVCHILTGLSLSYTLSKY